MRRLWYYIFFFLFKSTTLDRDFLNKLESMKLPTNRCVLPSGDADKAPAISKLRKWLGWNLGILRWVGPQLATAGNTNNQAESVRLHQ